MQLTKDEIEALIAASYEPAEHGVRLNGEKLVKDAIQHACDVAAEIVLRELDDNGQARAINDAIKEALK